MSSARSSPLRFHFFNPNGSISELPVILSHDDGKHRPLDRRRTWMDLRKGSQIVLWYPGKAPRLRRVDQVILWMSQPTVNGLPEIGREWIENGTILDTDR